MSCTQPYRSRECTPCENFKRRSGCAGEQSSYIPTSRKYSYRTLVSAASPPVDRAALLHRVASMCRELVPRALLLRWIVLLVHRVASMCREHVPRAASTTDAAIVATTAAGALLVAMACYW